MIRVWKLTLLAVFLASPGLASAEDAPHESLAHEVAEEQTGHDGDDGHGELTFWSLMKSSDFQGTLFNFAVLVFLMVRMSPAKMSDEIQEELKNKL